jgi:UDP-N-acetylglucosamine 1-carboxyvinyltransferase
MDVLRIKGGNRLAGEVEVPGSKNAALAILASVPLCPGRIVLHNVPEISDVRIKLALLEDFGAKVEWREGSVFIDCSEIHYHEPDETRVRPIRTSFYLLGPLLARLGKVRLPMPGGCLIGARPVDFHLKGLAALGATVGMENGCYTASANGLVGTEIYFDFPSAGATQHLMATSVLAKGVTTINNAAMEPEVVSLAQFLNCLGARIEGAGSSTISVTGVEQLGDCEFRIPADRVQAGTYLLAAAATRGDVSVTGILPEHQTAMVNKLREAGAEVSEGADWVRVAVDRRLKGIRVKTMPYPGFPTDMQQPMAAVLTLAKGNSVVEETIYESRIGHVPELNRMGAKVRVEGRATLIEGVHGLTGAVVHASDLRAGAALCLAALAAEGETFIKNVHFIDRGYDRLEERITKLGGEIERLDEETWERDYAHRLKSSS